VLPRHSLPFGFDIKARGYNLDIHGDPETLLADLARAEHETAELRDHLKAILADALVQMNVELLLLHYERIADTPAAIASLRHFILDLAVRGKLVPQDASDEAASELLNRLKKDQSQSLLKGSRKDKNTTSEPEHDLPASWLWVRIGDHLELINGMAFKPTDWKQTGIKIVRIQNLNRLDAPFNFCDPTMVRDRFLINNGAFLISWSGTPGTSFGAFIWERGKGVLNQHIFRCDFRLNAFDPLTCAWRSMAAWTK
jgi:type I restriction enzyme S subunit